MISIKEVINELEKLAPLSLQEDYDNAGLIIGDANNEVKGVLVSLDCTEAVVEDAISKGCNLIVSHHPIVFRGLKKITGANYIERVVISAIKNNIAIYAIHTNLDSVSLGVNKMIADKIGLINTRILKPKSGNLLKLIVYVPKDHSEKLRDSLFIAGAGKIGNYDSCSFNTGGEGTYKANENANPFKGDVDKLHHEAEVKIEVLLPDYLKSEVINVMIKSHPYEEVAYDIIRLENTNHSIGSGFIGELKDEMSEVTFLKMLKKNMKTNCIRHTGLFNKQINKVAISGGAGSFLINEAKKQGADVFITGDVKYHEFFDADNQMIIADIGHYESEQFTIDLIVDFLIEKFSKFAVQFTDVNTNPINYF